MVQHTLEIRSTGADIHTYQFVVRGERISRDGSFSGAWDHVVRVCGFEIFAGQVMSGASDTYVFDGEIVSATAKGGAGNWVLDGSEINPPLTVGATGGGDVTVPRQFPQDDSNGNGTNGENGTNGNGSNGNGTNGNGTNGNGSGDGIGLGTLAIGAMAAKAVLD